MKNFKGWFYNFTNSFSKYQRLQNARCKEWFKDNGDEKLRLNYQLNSMSLVYDVGGYQGEFASHIYNKYGSKIFIFEPVNSFFEIIKNKFLFNKEVSVFNYGLGSTSRIDSIALLDNSSSLYSKNGIKTNIKIKSVIEFMHEFEHSNVDLIKINIEGGEYELLEKLIDTQMIGKFKNIQVQFHDFVINNAEQRMESIQKKLEITHKLSWQYKFVWENWELK